MRRFEPEILDNWPENQCMQTEHAPIVLTEHAQTVLTFTNCLAGPTPNEVALPNVKLKFTPKYTKKWTSIQLVDFIYNIASLGTQVDITWGSL